MRYIAYEIKIFCISIDETTDPMSQPIANLIICVLSDSDDVNKLHLNNLNIYKKQALLLLLDKYTMSQKYF